MWPLDALRYDESIPGDDVYVFDEQLGELVPMSKTHAIERAHASGQHLFTRWLADVDAADGPVTCRIGKLELPLRWESVADETEMEVDEELWFEAPCGGRDFLIEGSPHTFPGRMRAWCPTKQRTYRVSLYEMGEMSKPARYYVTGYLSGQEPGPPVDDDGEIDDADLDAWHTAIERFRSTGSWFGRWSTCETCGCVLLPDSGAAACATCSTGTAT
jgi:hypothetical protein